MTRIVNLMGTGTAPLQAQATVGILTNSQTGGAAGNSGALALPSDYVVFTTVSGGSGTTLPSNANPGDLFTIVNHGAGTLIIYPPGTGTITTTQSLALNTLKSADIGCITPTTFWASVSA